MKPKEHKEVEIKVAVGDTVALERRLRDLGFHIHHPRVFESNVMYDLPNSDLRRRGELIRLRRSGQTAVFTYKGPAIVNRHKEREELEVTVDEAGVFEQILLRLGYVSTFRYEKYRTEWSLDGEDGLVMVDETPIGSFIEIEGPPEWIDRCAEQLGFRTSDYIYSSYARLYVDQCRASGVEVSHMVFGERNVE
jgi:adenylate cyclase class 2